MTLLVDGPCGTPVCVYIYFMTVFVSVCMYDTIHYNNTVIYCYRKHQVLLL